MSLTHFVNPLICWCAFNLSPPFGYYDYSSLKIWVKFCTCMLSLLLGKYLGGKWLCHSVSPHLTVWGTIKLFPNAAAPFYTPIYKAQGLQFVSLPHQHLLGLILLLIAIQMSVKWHLTVLLICISMMTNVLSIFSCACWSSEYLLWKIPVENVCLFLWVF